MRSQKVHFLTYLVKNQIDFTNPQEGALVAIPANADVTHISFSVDTESDAGVNANIGTADTPTLISQDIDLSKAETNIINKVYTTDEIQELQVSISGNPTKGSGTLRVIYYLPSTTTMEF